jgi:hypothetical protein
MKANNPITARVQAAFKNLTTPTNQEVTLNADGSGGPIVAPDGRVVNEPKKKQKSSTEDCGCGGSAEGAAAPAKQTASQKAKSEGFSGKAYLKGLRLQDKAKTLADKAAVKVDQGRDRKANRLYKRAARLEDKGIRIEEKEAKKYNY